jgi:hypothetical protein
MNTREVHTITDEHKQVRIYFSITKNWSPEEKEKINAAIKDFMPKSKSNIKKLKCRINRIIKDKK